MASQLSTLDPDHQNLFALQTWDANASWWDSYNGPDGDTYYKLMKLPALNSLLHLMPGLRLLELCAGNGVYARYAASQGSDVLATDGSERMVEIARQRCEAAEENGKGKTEWMALDVTSEAEMERFIGNRPGFDAVVCNFGLMDVADLEVMVRALPKLLRDGGVFVATLLHPVFATCYATREIRIVEDPVTGALDTKRSVSVSRYLNMEPVLGLATGEQPAPHPQFHRSFSSLFAPFFAAGMTLDGLVEKSFADCYPPDKNKVESWVNYKDFPHLLGFRMRNLKS